MRGLVSRLQFLTHSRTTRTLSYSSPGNWNVHVRPRRGLVDVVSGVVHDASGVVHDVSGVGHDVSHVVGDIITGNHSKVLGDVTKTGADVAKAGADVGKGVVKAVHSVFDFFEDAGSRNPNHDSGRDGGTQTDQEPHPTVPTGAGGGEDEQYPLPVSSRAPSSAGTSTSSTLPSSAYSTPIPLRPTLWGSPAEGAAISGWDPSSRTSSAESDDPSATSSASPEDGQSGNGGTIGASASTSTTQSMTTTGALTEGGGAHRKGFPLAAAATLGAVLGFLVVSALFWAVWLYLRRRRRAFHAVYLPPKRMLTVTSCHTVSTVPLFISASEAGVKDDSANPFRHPRDADEEEGDPFDAASLWRSSTTRSASTLSV